MKNFLLAFLGGGLGSIARYAISCLIGQNNVHTFPIATFISNVLACFIVGLVLGLVNEKQLLSPACKLFWTVGFCGGFSTFSAFSNESLNLFNKAHSLHL